MHNVRGAGRHVIGSRENGPVLRAHHALLRRVPLPPPVSYSDRAALPCALAEAGVPQQHKTRAHQMPRMLPRSSTLRQPSARQHRYHLPCCEIPAEVSLSTCLPCDGVAFQASAASGFRRAVSAVISEPTSNARYASNIALHPNRQSVQVC